MGWAGGVRKWYVHAGECVRACVRACVCVCIVGSGGGCEMTPRRGEGEGHSGRYNQLGPRRLQPSTQPHMLHDAPHRTQAGDAASVERPVRFGNRLLPGRGARESDPGEGRLQPDGLGARVRHIRVAVGHIRRPRLPLQRYPPRSPPRSPPRATAAVNRRHTPARTHPPTHPSLSSACPSARAPLLQGLKIQELFVVYQSLAFQVYPAYKQCASRSA